MNKKDSDKMEGVCIGVVAAAPFIAWASAFAFSSTSLAGLAIITSVVAPLLVAMGLIARCGK